MAFPKVPSEARPGPTDDLDDRGVTRRRQIVYFVLMAGASVVGLVKNLVFAKILGVDELAYYGIVVLALQYGVYAANWGILNGLNFRLPISYGRADAEPEAAAQRALGALLITTMLTAVLYLAVVFAVDPADPRTRTALALVALTVSVTTIAEFFVLMLRVRRELIPLALTFFARAVLAIVLGAAAGQRFGFEGVVIAEVIAVVVVVVLASHRWLPPLRPRRPAWAETTSLIRIGVPLTISNLAVAGTYTVDRVFVAGALPDDFGQYAFASIVVIAAFAISGIVAQVVGPQVLFEHGAGLNLAGVRRRLLRIVVMLAAAAAVGLVGLVGLIAVARDGVFAEYGPGLDVMPVLYLGATFAVLNIYGVVLWAAQRFRLVMLMSLLGTLVATVGGLVLVAGEPSLEDFAWLFVGAQGTATLGLAVATELLFRRDPVFRPAGGV